MDFSEKTQNGIRINYTVFLLPFSILMACLVFSLVNDKAFGKAMTSFFYWIAMNFGWSIVLAVFAQVVIFCFIAFSSIGGIRLGGPGAKPNVSTWNWFAMSLCAGIAIGILFWGTVEPIQYFSSPPESMGLKPFSEDAAIFSMAQCFLHWSFSTYGIYCIFGLPVALAHYNYRQRFAISSSLYFLIGDRCQGKIGDIVDGICLFALAGGMAASLGMGIMQTSSGLDFVFGIAPSKVIWTLVAVFLISSYCISSYTGINRGIRILSDNNAKLFIGFMIFVFFAGPTRFLLDLGVQSLGDFINNLPAKSMFLSPINGDTFPRWWDLFYWANWYAFAPIVGLFLVRLSYGRTVRQFLAVNLLLPACFGIIWFIVFGGTAIDFQMNGVNLWDAMQNKGVESAVFTFIQQLPLSKILLPIFLVIILVSFITLADSMTTTVSSLSVITPPDYQGEPPAAMKIAWGVIMGGVGLIMINFAGIDGIKMVSVVAGLPTFLLATVVIVSLLKGCYWPEMKWFGNRIPFGSAVTPDYINAPEK